jgi:transcriptional regulator with XRE-family HTH domain
MIGVTTKFTWMRRTVDTQNPQQLLAQYLRALREDHWPDRKITQVQLAKVLSVSTPLISSYESRTKPQIPPLARLEEYAVVFATTRSFDSSSPRVLDLRDLSNDERLVMDGLKQELMRLRGDALLVDDAPASTNPITRNGVSTGNDPWRFPSGQGFKIICPRWPEDILAKIPYTKVEEPDYVELLTTPELDALFELFGHLRAFNPDNQVNFRIAGKLSPDDLTSHLVTLGGIDYNTTTSSVLQILDLPVRQVADWKTEDGQYFEVIDGGSETQFRPVVEKTADREILQEDVALFVRTVNPYNRERTVTLCNGTYSRGVYGAVRILTDGLFRDRNVDYIRTRFGSSPSYCIVTRVPVINGATVTPDLTASDSILFEWSE